MEKKNLARGHRGEMFPHGLLEENGRQSTNCGRVVEEQSSVSRKRVTIAREKTTKESKKTWKDFIQ